MFGSTGLDLVETKDAKRGAGRGEKKKKKSQVQNTGLVNIDHVLFHHRRADKSAEAEATQRATGLKSNRAGTFASSSASVALPRPVPERSRTGAGHPIMMSFRLVL